MNGPWCLRTVLGAGIAMVLGASGCTCARHRDSDGAGERGQQEVVPVEGRAADSVAGDGGRGEARLVAARGAGATFALVTVGGKATLWRLDDGRDDPSWHRAVFEDGVQGELSLNVVPGGQQVVVIRHDGARGKALLVDSSTGGVRRDMPAGTLSCALEGGVFVLGPNGRDGPAGTQQRFEAPTPQKVLQVPPDREVSLACGARRAYVVAVGDEDTTLTVAGVAGEEPKPQRLARAGEPAGDDEREHLTYVVDDELGVLHVGRRGGLHLRETHAGVLGPWHPVSGHLPEEADVMVVEGSASKVVVLFTVEGQRCDGAPGAAAVHALVIPRGGGAPTTRLLEPAVCGVEPGGFFLVRAGDDVIAAWTEHRGDGWSLAVRPVEGDTLQRRPLESPFVAEGGCEGGRCFLVTVSSDARPRRVPLAGGP